MTSPFEPDLAVLRARRSAKWSLFPPDVLPLPVAEMDVRLADPVAAALHRAVDGSDTGYAGESTGLREAFAGFAARRWDWEVDPALVTTAPDVAVAGMEVMRALLRPGDGVVICPPVYPPFWPWLRAVGVEAVEVALGPGGALDLPGIEAALAAGARAVLLCHPQNPTGTLVPVDDLRSLARIALDHAAVVVSDEIHAPLALPGAAFVPFLAAGDEAAEVGIALQSASKAWNLAGLKCAQIVTGGPVLQDRLAPLADVLPWSVGHLGAIASEAAYRDGEPWLDLLLDALAANVDVLGAGLDERLPAIRWSRPEATFLAWLDCRALGLGENPAAAFLDRGRVALLDGRAFGPPGHGFVRVNIGCHPDVLRDAVTRMASAVG